MILDVINDITYWLSNHIIFVAIGVPVLLLIGSGPSHAISIKSRRFSCTRESLNKVLMLFIEENCFSHSAVDGQRIKEETQLLSYQYKQNHVILFTVNKDN